MKAKLTANKAFRIGTVDPRIYGSFVEHMGRNIYGGIYEPSHPKSDSQGFRDDVRELIRQLNIPLLRYPGGNFVSGYHWEDGTGDRSKRPRRLELAWKSIETNEVGIDEMQQWAKTVDAQLAMTVNLGTRGPEDAQNLVEYCNLRTDTHYANLRKQNGFPEPFGIKTWFLGNEMEGRWQICAKTAEEYGRLAAETAKVMKWTDPSIELVVCGSTGLRRASFGHWDLEVLQHTYEYVDYISIHMFTANKTGNYADFLARPMLMDEFIKTIAAVCDTVKAMKRSTKTMNISFDEWNVWYHSLGEKVEDWQVAPAILQDVYTFADALVVGCMLMTLQNNCDRVKIACMAQLVNVLAPILTENGGAAWAQTIFYPLLYAAKYGHGDVLRTVVDCEHYDTDDRLRVPYLANSVTIDENTRQITVFAVNRALNEDMTLHLELQGFGKLTMLEHTMLFCEDLETVNTKDVQAVIPQSVPVLPPFAQETELILPKHSWHMLRFAY